MDVLRGAWAAAAAQRSELKIIKRERFSAWMQGQNLKFYLIMLKLQ